MEITVLGRDDVPIGPFTPEQIRQKLHSGEFDLDDLAFMEGLSDWTSLRQVLSRMGGNTRPQLPPSQAYQARAELVKDLHYASVVARLVAYFIDGLILAIPLVIGKLALLAFAQSPSLTPPPGPTDQIVDPNGDLDIATDLGIIVLFMIARWLYFALQESGRAQATLGKRAMGLKVADLKGERIRFVRASIRYFGGFLSLCTFFIGYLMAGFTARRQTLHDIVAQTVVIRDSVS
jgi:uncharacterized RDD family membrane protein YckC